MQVKVLFFGVLKEITGRSEESIEVSPHATLAQVYDSYSERFETLRSQRSSILFARNSEFAPPSTPLSENDEIAFLPPVSGGATPALPSHDPHVFSLTRSVIRSQEFARTLQRPEDGAVVIFEGIVRNNTKGRATLYLEYECYEQLALKQIAQIGRQVADQYELGRLGVIHRLGRLEIGEASVVIVATAPHRRPAFQAALEAIDRLKREVPIWKKEIFSDGAVWVDGEWDERLLARS